MSSARRVATRWLTGSLTLYHWAPKRVRASIRQHGLDHRLGPPSDPRSRAPAGIYFHRTLADALDMGADGLDRTHDLYEVRATGLRLRPDPYQPEDAVFTTQAIPPSAIQRIR